MAGGSFEKREREKQQRERAEAKRRRRLEPTEEPTDAPDTEALMERFRVLSEAHASGAIDRATYEAQRSEIFDALGLGDPR